MTAAQLVGNDTDPDGDELSVASVSGAVHGAAVLNADGTITSLPQRITTGPASFTYQVKDAAGAVSANSATVAVTVTPATIPRSRSIDSEVSTAEDTALTLTAAQLVGNDTDPDADDTLSVASVSGALYGTVVLNNDGTVTFTPISDYHGAAVFSYQVMDSAGAVSANAATVAVAVTAVNDAPYAADDDATTIEDTAIPIAVVGNDSDVEATRW